LSCSGVLDVLGEFLHAPIFQIYVIDGMLFKLFGLSIIYLDGYPTSKSIQPIILGL